MSARERPRRRDLLELLLEYMEELQRASEEVFETLLEPSRPSWDVRDGCIEPLTHISVSPDEVIVTMDLPFVKPETIRVKPVEEDLIEVVAEMRKALKPRDLGVVHVEGELRQLRCRTRLPVPVEIRAMKFEFRKGILEVRLPRKKVQIS
ncbi:hypothetical protein B6U66_04340 [Candidatus Bathyarchaeota archaeon ex4484_135]|nr:MAG: hypothetical protein B6U66_04340 [Candidatus Bathyarchaeota archaeon ex4484_135]